jgi:hypothetical protein
MQLWRIHAYSCGDSLQQYQVSYGHLHLHPCYFRAYSNHLALLESDLRKHFSTKGHVSDVKVLPHRRIGYVGFKTPQEAAEAVRYFNRSFIRMSRINVELAKPVSGSSAEQYTYGANFPFFTDR